MAFVKKRKKKKEKEKTRNTMKKKITKISNKKRETKSWKRQQFDSISMASNSLVRKKGEIMFGGYIMSKLWCFIALLVLLSLSVSCFGADDTFPKLLHLSDFQAI